MLGLPFDLKVAVSYGKFVNAAYTMYNRPLEHETAGKDFRLRDDLVPKRGRALSPRSA
jgi:hypothetical protein